MKIKHHLFATVAVGLLALNACGKNGENGEAGSAGPAAASKGLAPHETVMKSVQALRNNDLKSFLSVSLPADKYQEVQQQWEEKKQEPVTEEDKQEYANTMQQLTQDGAVDNIMAQLEPQLDQMRQQMPMFVGMFQGIAQSAITQSKDMTDEQKQQAQKAVTAMTAWAQRTDLASPDLARKAVSAAVDTARKLDLPTLDAVHQLSFDQMLDKGGVLLGGVKDVLAVYDLDVNHTLDSVNAETVSQDGEAAKVKTTFDFLGTQQEYVGDYVKVNGRWVAKEAMETHIQQVAGDQPKADDTDE